MASRVKLVGAEPDVPIVLGRQPDEPDPAEAEQESKAKTKPKS